jgi:hypothetical protein
MYTAPSPGEGGDSSDRADEEAAGRNRAAMGRMRCGPGPRLTRGIVSPDITNQESLVLLKVKRLTERHYGVKELCTVHLTGCSAGDSGQIGGVRRSFDDLNDLGG